MSVKRRMVRRSGRNGHPARTSERGLRQLGVYFGATLAIVLGLQALYAARDPRSAARPPDAHGLRVAGEGRADATRVLPAALFADPRVRNAYASRHRSPALSTSCTAGAGASSAECGATSSASRASTRPRARSASPALRSPGRCGRTE